MRKDEYKLPEKHFRCEACPDLRGNWFKIKNKDEQVLHLVNFPLQLKIMKICKIVEKRVKPLKCDF